MATRRKSNAEEYDSAAARAATKKMIEDAKKKHGKLGGKIYDSRKFKKNPKRRPSLVGGIADTFFPIDLMESSAEGFGNDLSTAVHAIRNGRTRYQVVRVTGPFRIAIPNGHYFPSLHAVKKWAKNLVSSLRPKPKTVDVILHDK